MRKSRIGKKIYDVVTPEEYIEADKANPEASQNLMDDTAIMDNGYVYPLNKQYSKNNPGVTDCGPMLVFSHPDSMNTDGDYKADHIIDFNDVLEKVQNILYFRYPEAYAVKVGYDEIEVRNLTKDDCEFIEDDIYRDLVNWYQDIEKYGNPNRWTESISRKR